MSKTAQQLIEQEYLLMRGILSEDHEKVVDDILALDEISKKTLGSYIKGAKVDAEDKMNNYHSSMDSSHEYGETQSDKEISRNMYNQALKHKDKAQKRLAGIVKASKRLTKEQKELIGSILEELEAEEINEILDYKTMSLKTLQKHLEKHQMAHGNATTNNKKLQHLNQIGIIKDVIKSKKEFN